MPDPATTPPSPLTPAQATPPAEGAPAHPTPVRGSVRLRVRYCECDPMGVAHHASFIPWLEIGRTELLREGEVSYAQLERAGVFLVVVKLDARYRRRVLYDDVVEVRTKVTAGSRVKIQHSYAVVVVQRNDKPAEEVAMVAATTLACVDREGRPIQVPEWLVPTRASA